MNAHVYPMEAVAMDALCIVGKTKQKYCTDIYVNFYASYGVAGTFISSERKKFEQDTVIELYCNDVYCNDRIVTFLGPDRLVKFDIIGGTENSFPSTIPNDAILSKLPLVHGRNNLVFVHKATNTTVSCILWLWSYKDRIMVCDIDGTITRSDVRGYLETVYMSYYKYCHKGVIEFFHQLEAHLNLKIIFLTSRPIAHLQMTKNLLNSLRPVGVGDGTGATSGPNALPTDANGSFLSLPDGPVFTNRDAIATAAYKELVLRVSAEYKANVLYGVLQLYYDAHQDYKKFKLASMNDNGSVAPSDPLSNDSMFAQSEDIQNKTTSDNPVHFSTINSNTMGSISLVDDGDVMSTPFVLGFGNRPSDAKAYLRNGIPPSAIFIINKASHIRLWTSKDKKARHHHHHVHHSLRKGQYMERNHNMENDDLSINSRPNTSHFHSGSNHSKAHSNVLSSKSTKERDPDSESGDESRQGSVHDSITAAGGSGINSNSHHASPLYYLSYHDPLLMEYAFQQVDLYRAESMELSMSSCTSNNSSMYRLHSTEEIIDSVQNIKLGQMEKLLSNTSDSEKVNSSSCINTVERADETLMLRSELKSALTIEEQNLRQAAALGFTDDESEEDNSEISSQCIQAFCAPGVMVAFKPEANTDHC